MKIVHKKKVHRYLSFFRNHFGFREPYQILIDGTFCLAALEGQVRVAEQLEKYFQCPIKLLTTQCVIIEMERIGPSVAGALRICKQFLLHKCGHEKQPVSAYDCIKSMIKPNGQNNPARYIVASQDNSLKSEAREVPGTPILYLHIRSPTLEKPSDASSNHVQENSLTRNDDSYIRLMELKKSQGLLDESAPKLKKRRPKNPNPLSCKKKKPKPNQPQPTPSQEGSVQKKKRKRIKIPKHVKQELLSASS